MGVQVLWKNIEGEADDWRDQPPDGPIVVLEVSTWDLEVRIEWEWG